jgi:hypothetical protein
VSVYGFVSELLTARLAVHLVLAFFARHSRERGLRFISAEPNIQRLQALSHERHWMFGSAEIKRSPRSRE